MKWKSERGLDSLRKWRSRRPDGPNRMYLFLCSFLFFPFLLAVWGEGDQGAPLWVLDSVVVWMDA